MYVLVTSEYLTGLDISPLQRPSWPQRISYELRNFISRFRYRRLYAQTAYTSFSMPESPILVLDSVVSKTVGDALRAYHNGCEAIVGKHKGRYFVVCSDSDSGWHPGDQVLVQNRSNGQNGVLFFAFSRFQTHSSLAQ